MAFNATADASRLLGRSLPRSFRVELNEDVVTITGPQNRDDEYTSFISALSGTFWNEIPRSTRIHLSGILIDVNDNNIYGDVWGFRWMIDHFGDNISFDHCYAASNRGLENRGRYNTLYEVTRHTRL